MNDLRKTKAQLVSNLAELRQRVTDLETAAALNEAQSAGLAADRDLKDELLHLACNLAQAGGWEFDALTFKGTWTEEVARIHDLDPAQETNVELGVSFYSAESRVKIDQAIKDAIEQAKPYDLEVEMVSAKGVPKWVRTIGLPTVDGGRVVRVRGIFQDITERKRARDALLASEEKYRTLFDNLT
ncbi:MAG: PAS domain-containing protein, partial [Chloroflexi bacterium]|nr:PAS domain-containing protein [Chloroflexota bacterium]